MRRYILLTNFLFFLSFSINAQVQIQWHKILGGTGHDRAQVIQQTTDGGYVLAGYTISNDGDVSGNHGNNDYWVVKLDVSGDIQWQKCFGGNGDETIWFVQQTNDSGYIVCGSTASTNGIFSINHGASDVYILKLDSIGNTQWQKLYGGTGGEGGMAIQTPDGEYIIAGSTNSNGFDVSGNHGDADAWILKLDYAGNFKWQNCYGGTSSDYASSIQNTTDGGFIFAGTSMSDDGNATVNHGSTDFWVVKIDSLGIMQWQKSLGGTGVDNAHSIQQTNDGGYIVVGGTNSNDGDVSGYNVDASGNAWIVKLDTAGNILWQRSYGGSNNDNAYSIEQTSIGEFIFAGISSSIDGDLYGNTGEPGAWIVKLDTSGNIIWQKSLGIINCDLANFIQKTNDGGYIVAGNTNFDFLNNIDYDIWVAKLIEPNLSGFVFNDENNNGIHDTGELGVIGHLLKLEPGPVYTFTDNNGYYHFVADSGAHTVSYIPSQYWSVTSSPMLQFNVDSAGYIIDTLDFAIKYASNINDVSVFITGTLGIANSGIVYWLTYKNLGTQTASGTIYFQYDSLLTYNSSTQTPYMHIGNVISWNYGPMGNGEQQTIRANFQATGYQYFGDSLFGNTWITPLFPDTNNLNNYDTIYQVVTSPVDPNDKQVSPHGISQDNYVIQGQKLTYTIRFQNTGTDTAFTVIIRDTLNPNLDIETFLVESYSHPVNWELEHNNELVFTFSEILLPDDNVNEPLSHGFIRYSIDPKPGLNEYTVVNNTAYIFFDFNPAIVTNNTLNTYISYIPTSLSENIAENNFIIVSPNPVSENLSIEIQGNKGNVNFEIFNTIDQIVFKGKVVENTVVQTNNFLPGVYIIKAQTDKGVVIQKFIKE